MRNYNLIKRIDDNLMTILLGKSNVLFGGDNLDNYVKKNNIKIVHDKLCEHISIDFNETDKSWIIKVNDYLPWQFKTFLIMRSILKLFLSIDVKSCKKYVIGFSGKSTITELDILTYLLMYSTERFNIYRFSKYMTTTAHECLIPIHHIIDRSLNRYIKRIIKYYKI